MKIQIKGASNFVNRMFEACGRFQWAREFLQNAIEARATKVEFGIEFQAVEKAGVYRRTIIDDGEGMTGAELLAFFSTLGEGGKKIGGVHDNFGVGAKIASLPWNPEGMVVISYKDGVGALIWILFDEASGEYELVEFETDAGTQCVIDPADFEDDTCDWGKLRPDWLTEHGTIIVLLGSEDNPHTVLGNPLANESDIKGLSTYLNSRFWELSGADVAVVELRSNDPAKWPTSAGDRDDSRRPNRRSIEGAKHYLTGVSASAGRLAHSAVVPLADGRVNAEWYLWEGERPAVHSYAKKGGYIAIRYRGELFELTASKAHFRWFGVIESKIQQNLTIVLEPQLYDATAGVHWGIHPDQSRNRMIFSGDGDKGVGIPLSDWGLDFAEDMPDEIREAIRRARGEGAGSLDDEEYRKRLQDRFGDRWKVRARVVKLAPEEGDETGSATGGTEEVDDLIKPRRPRTERKRRKKRKVVRRRAADGSDSSVEEREVDVSVPNYSYSNRENFKQPWHLAAWMPTDPSGPTVYLNADSPILTDLIEFHQNRYPDVYAEEVAKTIKQVFGEVAVAKVAHSQKLSPYLPTEQIDREYRDEQALTVALMGLLAEESLIERRLTKLGRKKAPASAAAAA